MEIIFLGTKLDSSKEHEKIANLSVLPYGFNVEITYNEVLAKGYSNLPDGYVLHKDNEVLLCNNVTEFHWLYKPNCMACESDIHYTGFSPWNNGDFKSIVVTAATEKSENFS